MPMVSALETLPSARTATGVWSWLYGIVARLRTVAAAPTPTETERNAERLMELAASRLGARLLDAASLDDLDDRIDAMVDSSEIAHLDAMSIELMEDLDSEAETSPESFQAFAREVAATIGASQARLLADAADLVDWRFRSLRKFVVELRQHARDEGADVSEMARSISLLDPEILPEAALAGLASRRAELSLLAVIRAVLTKQVIEPWLARALVERFLEGSRGHLRFLASMVDGVPESIVPQSDRFDLPGLIARHEHSRRISRRALEQARRSDEGVGAGVGDAERR